MNKENVKSRGLMFKSELVLAILSGKKTQTRRIVKLPLKRDSFVMMDYGKGFWPYQSDDGESALCNDSMEYPYSCPFGKAGDLIYIRETFALTDAHEPNYHTVTYKADGKDLAYDLTELLDIPHNCAKDIEYSGPWSPAIHMRKDFARIWLEVLDIKVEKLQDIGEEDALAEGVTIKDGQTAREAFFELWNTTGSDYKDNPWVWVVSFKKMNTLNKPK